MNAVKDRRLEDFGLREIVGADERLRQYREDCRSMGKTKKARFWLEVLENDPEVRELVSLEHQVYNKTWGARR